MFYNDKEGKIREIAGDILAKYYNIIQVSFDSEGRVMSKHKLGSRIKMLALAEIDAILNTDMINGREMLNQVRDYISNS